MNLQELLKIAGEQGKVVVVDESGNVKGVLLTYDAFQQLSKTNETAALAPAKPITPAEDQTEKVNRAILEAQLNQEESVENLPPMAATMQPQVERLDSLLSRRAEQLFKSMPHNRSDAIPRTVVDMRSEVIDPNYDFNAPEISVDDEEIRPNFDDI